MLHHHTDALVAPVFIPQHSRPPPATAELAAISSSPTQVSPSPPAWHRKPDRPGSATAVARSASEEFPTPFFDTRDRQCRSFSHPSARAIYPSPPSPSGDRARKSSVPLPDDEAPGSGYLPVYAAGLDAVLDSPEVMHRVDLAGYKPLTPPPTQRHPTQALPDDDDDEEEDDDEQCTDDVPGGHGTEEEEDEDGDGDFYDDDDGDEDMDIVDDEECEAEAQVNEVPPVLEEDSTTDQPPSPLSPEWLSPFDDANSALLNDSSSHPSTSSNDDFWMPLWSPESPRAGKSGDLLPPDLNMDHDDEDEDEDDDDDDDALNDLPRLDFSPIRDHLCPNPSAYHHHHRSPSPLFRRDDEHEPRDFCPPSSPSISSLDLPELDDEPPLVMPESPSIRSAAILPDSDVIMVEAPHPLSIISPSQGLLSLPGGDVDDDLLPALSASPGALFVPPLTPSEPLLLLEDPQDVPFPRSPSPEDFDLGFGFGLSADDGSASAGVEHPEAGRLLELRRRSIAAERAASRLEHAAVSGGVDVDLMTRAEARRIRRREKERSREVSALLRLKMDEWCGAGVGVGAGAGSTPVPASTSTGSGDVEGSLGEGSSSSSSLGSSASGGLGGSPEKERKSKRACMFGSVRHLVAQMYFRRSDVSRPITKRRPAAPQEYVRSSLSHSVSTTPLDAAADVDADVDADDSESEGSGDERDVDMSVSEMDLA
ncbi:hypothetical protein CONPUDRAFT_80177 [Coniophora puteana RWD-64-598 SS2]|uniref:Uncharacterized protein n=1 Tax=Coniophora puteana (strain RWD-64-598) TaxID=741705 RepID=A0A5M3N2T6_CONPW|nr:uncharacterized protein CONPUDRAFT_80177 [Coniophora puteana RWD-64-598 SS2]EIW85699.1 hypothetical protein CONPUDRAFT_80177 [Coniophora puteana RWD-64-598 SS2]